MQNDFEVHPIGTTSEIKLSRELAKEIESVMDQFGPGIVPNGVRQAYERLYNLYMKQIHEGLM